MPPESRALAIEALVDVEAGRAHAREAVAARRGALRDPRDRSLLTKVVYETVRRRATLDALLAPCSRRRLEDLDPRLRAALRSALTQALLFPRFPPWAAVGAAVEAVKAFAGPAAGGYANAVLRVVLRGVEGDAAGPEDPRRDVPRPGRPSLRMRHPVFADPASDLAENLAARYAHPAWLVRRWLARHGGATARAMLEAGASRPPVVLRARPGTRDALLAELAAAGATARAGEQPEEAVVEDGDVEALVPVRAGRAAVQDGTAQRVAPLCDPRPGDRVLDLCAAPGGKTLHLLELLGDRGEVVAGDAAPERVEPLAAVLAGRPAGGPAARALLVPREGALPFAAASFDSVLVDAPCSNTGVLRRRLEVRDRLREPDVASLASLQRDLVARALPLVRAGGRLVYATCSVEPEEGADNAAAMLAAAPPGTRLDPGFDVLPALAHDGGYAAVLVVP